MCTSHHITLRLAVEGIKESVRRLYLPIHICWLASAPSATDVIGPDGTGWGGAGLVILLLPSILASQVQALGTQFPEGLM
mmetsp:Transcript_3853/g.5852  ORF Transcript_3853/g.5852 Transcript_3853/m.5852 type:complete len:80 (+) Transcript_3853:246-485(+)